MNPVLNDCKTKMNGLIDEYTTYLHHIPARVLPHVEISFIIYVAVNFLFQLIFIFPLFQIH